MTEFISLILGALLGVGGLLYWQKHKPTKPPEPTSVPKGGGPRNTPPPP